MPDDTGDLGLAHGADLAIQPLAQVEGAGPQFPSPAQVTDAMRPVLVARERRVAIGRVSDETPNRVGVQGEEKGNKQVVHVPKRLERLLSDTMMRRRVHQEHAQKHYVTRDTTGLDVVDLHGGYRSNLALLNVVEAARG
jgi:hypothetical protein